MTSWVVLPPKTAIFFFIRVVPSERSVFFMLFAFFKIHSLSKGYSNSRIITYKPFCSQRTAYSLSYHNRSSLSTVRFPALFSVPHRSLPVLSLFLSVLCAVFSHLFLYHILGGIVHADVDSADVFANHAHHKHQHTADKHNG